MEIFIKLLLTYIILGVIFAIIADKSYRVYGRKLTKIDALIFGGLWLFWLICIIVYLLKGGKGDKNDNSST